LTSFFALVVFLVDGFFTAAAFFEVAGAFFGAAADFLTVVAFSFDTLVLVAAAFFAGVGLDDSVTFFVDVPFLDGGFVFCDRLSNVQRKRAQQGYTSLASAGVLGRLGASLTLPDGPLGKTKVSFSAPRVSAKLS
jgi:hypothetical protein